MRRLVSSESKLFANCLWQWQSWEEFSNSQTLSSLGYDLVYAKWTVLTQLFEPVHFQLKGVLVVIIITMFNRNSCNTYKVDPDQTPRSAVSGLGRHFLPVALIWNSHKWVNTWMLSHCNILLKENMADCVSKFVMLHEKWGRRVY